MASTGDDLVGVPQQNPPFLLLSPNGQSDDDVIWRSASRPQENIARGEARSLVQRLSHAFVSEGIINPSGGDKVIIATDNQPLAFVSVLAAIASGGVVATCPWQASVRELLFRVEILKPKAVLCCKAVLEMVQTARSQSPHDFAIIVHDTASMTIRMNGNVSMLPSKERPLSRNWSEQAANAPAVIVFSSGTTGSPKAVCISQDNVISMIYQLRALWSPFLKKRQSRSIMLATLDCAHVAGLFLNTFCGLGVGLETIFAPASDVKQVLAAFNTFPVEVFPTVPAVLQRIIDDPIFASTDFSHIKFTCTGAAKSTEEAKKTFSQALSPGVFCQEAWGMTELTFLATMHETGPPGPWSSIGKPLAGNTIEIRSLEGQKVDVGQDGEIYIHGPTVTPGYYLADVKDHESTSNGWLRTGDVGHVDADGYVYVTGRNKELIKYNGTQIAPRELEDIIRTSSYVIDVAVVGMELPNGNELPTAFVVLAEKTPKDIATLLEQTVKDQVSAYKRLRGGVYVVKEIPRNPMGKILLGQVKDWAKEAGKKRGVKARL